MTFFIYVYAAESTLLVCKNGSESKLQNPNHPRGKSITISLPSSQGNFGISPSLSLSHFLILGFFKDISEFFFFSFSVCLVANCFRWFFSSAYNAFYGVHR